MPKSAAFGLLLATLSLLWLGCQRDVVYDETRDLPNHAWSYADSLRFEFDIADTTKVYSIGLDLTHAGDYAYQNLYVRIHTYLASGEVKKQVVSLELATKAGTWNGECGSNWCEIEIPIQPKARFKSPGHYAITVEQFMRDTTLAGIKSLGLKVKTL